MHDDELGRFKRDIHLAQFAVQARGYVLDRRASSRACHVLRHLGSDDKIVVRQDADGHWTYFSVRDGRDHGTIVDFLLARGARGLADVREELRRYLCTERPAPDSGGGPRAPFRATRAPAEVFEAAKRAGNSAYLNARGIRPETLAHPRFAGTWRLGAHENVLFVHRDERGELTGFEVKNHGLTRFATGGHKSAWQSAAEPDDRAIVLTESAIDALSHHQLHREGARATRYLSTAGAPSRSQIALLDAVFGHLPAGCTVVAAVDADAAGQLLAARIEALARRHAHLGFARDAPPGAKDWNEVLQRAERDFIRSLAPRARTCAVSADDASSSSSPPSPSEPP